MNNIPCKDCKFYDAILGPAEKITKRGWCVKKSLYPAKEGRGQNFPYGAKRVKPGELAKPHIVRGEVVVEECKLASQKMSMKKASR